MLCLLTMVLAGCGSSDTSDLQAFIDEARAKPNGSIEPEPQSPTYEPFTYAAAALRSPFQAPVRIDPTARQRGNGNIKPDLNRPKQFLEGFNIETFNMVGTLANAEGRYALVSGAGGVHRVKVGDYLGRNDGRITKITDGEIDVIEIVPDGEGGWLERPRTITLKEKT
ncbi:pilus assembly protein PilP [Pseudomonas oryzihabitans]|nr:pilus assembly protein PilP [Pseudomonas psychrotolerans]